MDIPSFLTTYGGPGGIVAVAAWFFLSDRKFNAERRAELREDIDREQKDNADLRAALLDEKAKRIAAESERDQERARCLALEDQLRILQRREGGEA